MCQLWQKIVTDALLSENKMFEEFTMSILKSQNIYLCEPRERQTITKIPKLESHSIPVTTAHDPVLGSDILHLLNGMSCNRPSNQSFTFPSEEFTDSLESSFCFVFCSEVSKRKPHQIINIFLKKRGTAAHQTEAPGGICARRSPVGHNKPNVSQVAVTSHGGGRGCHRLPENTEGG